jgi:hypothetical protein
VNDLRAEKERLRNDQMQMEQLYQDLIGQLAQRFNVDLESSDEAKDLSTEMDGDQDSEEPSDQELKEYISMLESENRTLKEDLATSRRTSSALMQEEVFYLKRLAANTSGSRLTLLHYIILLTQRIDSPYGSPNTSSTSTGSRNQKVIVPLKPGSKKIKQSLVSEEDLTHLDDDDEIDASTTSVLKCGYVHIMYYEMVGSERRVAWKKRWLVLPNMSTTIKCYKQLKSLKAMEILISDSIIQENTVIKGDTDKSAPCFSIKTAQNKTFVVKVC